MKQSILSELTGDKWEKHDRRRCELIEKRINGGRTNMEEIEFNLLQSMLMARRRLINPLPTRELKDLLAQLRQQRKRRSGY